MKIILLLVLFISSFAQASSYFWSCGDTVGSRKFWDRGVLAGSNYYWQKGEGPGSRYYWLNGTGYGSKYYYLNNEGAWTNYSYQRETNPGSFYFWNNGQGPGSRYYFERGNEASTDGVITALCMQGVITHPLCLSIRQPTNSQRHYCINQSLNHFLHLQQLINTTPIQQFECEEINGF